MICPDRSYEIRSGGIGGNSSFLTDFFEDCQAIVSVEEEEEFAFSLLNTLVETNMFVFSNGTNAQLSVISTTGRLVHSQSLAHGDNLVDLSFLAQGTYVVQLINEKGRLTHQIVKQ